MFVFILTGVKRLCLLITLQNINESNYREIFQLCGDLEYCQQKQSKFCSTYVVRICKNLATQYLCVPRLVLVFVGSVIYYTELHINPDLKRPKIFSCQASRLEENYIKSLVYYFGYFAGRSSLGYLSSKYVQGMLIVKTNSTFIYYYACSHFVSVLHFTISSKFC